MNELLANPVVQSAAIPFTVALLAALVLRPLGGTASGLGFALGFAASAYFVMGFNSTGVKFTPLTGTRKLLLAGIGAVLVGVVADFALPRERKFWPRAALFALAGIAAALWLAWPRLDRLEGNALWFTAIAAPAFAAWLALTLDDLNRRPLGLAVATLVLGIGLAVSAAGYGASLQVGQLAGAVAAAAGALALLFVLLGRLAPGGGFALPAALLLALGGISAVMFARLPWYALAPLALVPLLARLPVPATRGRFVQGLVLALYTAPAAAGAILLAWHAGQSSSSY